MTAIETKMSNNEYWNKISYSPSAYFDEFPLHVINEILATDIDCLNSFETIIKEENEELSPTSSIEVKNFNSFF